ncbi:hypothetical protein FS749_001244 [Ceratobasidium sp. UAMH 11750]|nr:hypothetical protein FS749_001244 [Ceratobasidium sp. UAMH 11750]
MSPSMLSLFHTLKSDTPEDNRQSFLTRPAWPGTTRSSHPSDRLSPTQSSSHSSTHPLIPAGPLSCPTFSSGCELSIFGCSQVGAIPAPIGSTEIQLALRNYMRNH